MIICIFFCLVKLKKKIQQKTSVVLERISQVKAIIIIIFFLTIASAMYAQRNLGSGQETAIDDCQATEGRSDLLKWHGTPCLKLSGTLHIFQLLNTNA